MAFFDEWQLWAKMVFVLACAIVITVGAAFVKLSLDHRALKKHAQMEMNKEQARPMVENYAVREQRGRGQALFGIRAIQSGIEVEGVWNSSGNSPASSMTGSPRLAAQDKLKEPSSAPEIPDLTIPLHTYTDRSRSPARASTGSFERATSAERIIDSYPSTPSSRQAYKPQKPSSLRFNSADEMESGYAHVRNTSGPYRSGSDSSASSFDTSPIRPQTEYGDLYEQRPSYKATSYAKLVNRHSVAVEYVPFPDSSRASFEHGSRESIASPPRSHHPSSSHLSFPTPFQQTPVSRDITDMHYLAQQEPLMDNYESKDSHSSASISPEQVKRTTRKLQKKRNPSIST